VNIFRVNKSGWMAAVIVGIFLVSCGPKGPETVQVSLSDFMIVLSTDTVSGSSVIFEVTNEGFIEHNFAVEGVDGAKIDLVIPQDASSIEIALEPGTYTLICDLPGHRDAGMEVQFTVSP